MKIRSGLLAALVFVSVGPAANAAIVTGLEAYWRLNETSGSTTAANSSPNTPGLYTGTLAGNTDFVLDGTRGQVAVFDGTQDNILSSNPVDVTGGTILGWVKLDDGADTGSRFMFPGQSGPGGQRIYIYSGDGDLKVGLGNSGSNVTISNALDNGVDVPAWHQVAVTWADAGGGAGTVSVYLDGTLAGSAGYNALTTAATWLSIGSNYDPGDVPPLSSGWMGLISEVGVWDRELSGAEVSTVFNQGFILPIPEPSSLMIAVIGFAAICSRRVRQKV